MHARFVFEDRLRAVAVVDVEIDDRDPRQAVAFERMRGGDGDVVEQAEAHRDVAGGMVPGRAHRAEGDVDLALEHGIGRGDARACGTQAASGNPATAPCRVEHDAQPGCGARGR